MFRTAVAAAFVSITVAARPAASQTAADRIAAARAQIQSRHLDSARALLNEVLEPTFSARLPERATAFLWLGIVGFYEGDDAATVRNFRAALALDPQINGDDLGRVDSTLAAAWKREQARAARSDSALATSAVVLPTLTRSGPLRYPEDLRRRGIQGRVYAEVMVDTLGDPEPESIRILASPNRAFDGAVRDWLRSATFTPGTHEGRRERMTVIVPVDFTIAASPPGPGAPVGSEPDVHDCVRGCKGGEQSPRLLELPQMRFDSPGNLGPSGVHGRVVVRAVVDASGRLEPETISLVTSSSSAFERSVRDILPQLRFRPATAGGEAVAALVELRFDIRPEGLDWVRYEVSTP